MKKLLMVILVAIMSMSTLMSACSTEINVNDYEDFNKMSFFETMYPTCIHACNACADWADSCDLGAPSLELCLSNLWDHGITNEECGKVLWTKANFWLENSNCTTWETETAPARCIY